jgi:phosphoserine phosphatase
MAACMSVFLTLAADREAFSLTPALVNRVGEAVRAGRPETLSEGEAVDLPLSAAPDPTAVRAALEGAPVDALLSPMRGRRRGLLVADMDGTIVTGETLDALADLAGVGGEIAAITTRCMNGDIDFAVALRQRAALLKGLDMAALDHVRAGTCLTPGAKTLVATMRAHGALTALVTGGFACFAEHVAQSCGFDEFRANDLLHDGTRLTGEIAEPILDGDAKRDILRELAAKRGVRLRATLALGDGANDLAMLREAGLAIGYRPKPPVAAAIPNRLDFAGLRGALFAQGYPAARFSE